MIEGQKVIVATVMTNVVKHKYWPVSEHSLRSFCNTDYVDEVIIVDGQSIDDTIKMHSGISDKVKFLSGPKWDTNDLSQTNFIRQNNTIYDYCCNLNEDVILIFECADVFFTDVFRAECKNVIKKIINESYDFCILPFAKMMTPWYQIQYSYKQTDDKFFNVCVSRFAKGDRLWSNGLVNDGMILDPARQTKKLIYDWKSTVIAYECWHFNKQAFENKIQTHYNWDKNLSIDETIKRMYTWKIKSMPGTILTLTDHPPEVIPVLKSLQKDHLGFSLFGHISTPMTYEEFDTQMRLI
jgi:hypothetical protein